MQLSKVTNFIFLGLSLMVVSALSVNLTEASLIGDSVEGDLAVRDINTGTPISPLGVTNIFNLLVGGVVTNGSGTPQTVGAGTEFFIHSLNAGAYGSTAIDQFLDIDVDIAANSFSVTIGGNFLSNPGGIIPAFDLVLSDLDWVGNPSAVITGVTPTSIEFTTTSVSFTDHAITLLSPQFSSSFGGPASFTNVYDIAASSGSGGGGSVIPEPSTYLLFTAGLLGLIGIGYRQRKRVV